MTDRLAEIKTRNERDKTIHESMGIPLPQQWLDEMWLIAEVERLRPDAERWQHARTHGLVDVYSSLGISMSKVANYVMYDEAADVAVDAARKAT